MILTNFVDVLATWFYLGRSTKSTRNNGDPQGIATGLAHDGATPLRGLFVGGFRICGFGCIFLSSL